jgi:hypothetical protein
VRDPVLEAKLMRKVAVSGRLALAMTVLAVVLTGCAHHNITGTGSRHAQVYHGSLRLTGEDNEITVLSGSNITKLSIMGEDNLVYVEEGALLEKVEIVGDDNEVVCPEGMPAQYNQIGEDNRIKRALTAR